MLSGPVIGFPLFLHHHLTIPRTIHQPLRSRGLLQRLFRSSYVKIASKKILLHKRQLHGFFNGILWSISGYVFRVIGCTNVCFVHSYVTKEICKKISRRGDSRSIGLPCTFDDVGQYAKEKSGYNSSPTLLSSPPDWVMSRWIDLWQKSLKNVLNFESTKYSAWDLGHRKLLYTLNLWCKTHLNQNSIALLLIRTRKDAKQPRLT